MEGWEGVGQAQSGGMVGAKVAGAESQPDEKQSKGLPV